MKANTQQNKIYRMQRKWQLEFIAINTFKKNISSQPLTLQLKELEKRKLNTANRRK